jgi:hypothetical protein
VTGDRLLGAARFRTGPRVDDVFVRPRIRAEGAPPGLLPDASVAALHPALPTDAGARATTATVPLTGGSP